MSTPLILEPLLGEARAAALAGGLKTVTRLFVRIGDASGLDAEEVERQLLSYFAGPLFEACEVSIESGRGGGLKLVSIEGYVAPSVACP